MPNIWERDPLEIAASPDLLAAFIEYLKTTYANVKATEAEGKRITKKAARKGMATETPDDTAVYAIKS